MTRNVVRRHEKKLSNTPSPSSNNFETAKNINTNSHSFSKLFIANLAFNPAYIHPIIAVPTTKLARSAQSQSSGPQSPSPPIIDGVNLVREQALFPARKKSHGNPASMHSQLDGQIMLTDLPPDDSGPCGVKENNVLCIRSTYGVDACARCQRLTPYTVACVSEWVSVELSAFRSWRSPELGSWRCDALRCDTSGGHGAARH